MTSKIKNLGEIGLIERLTKRIKLDKSVVLGAGDDAAVIRWTRDRYLLYTCDMIIEDVHFRLKDAAPFQIGRKALAVNISDIAAMGGVPRYAVISIGINPATPVSFVDRLYRGIEALAKRFKINIVGGDTNSSRKLVIDISLLGEVEKENLVTRSGAKRGDLILITGAIGGSIKGRHLNFMPRLAESRRLVKNFKINSMIDVSDGLILDLGRILKASSCGAVIYEMAVPLSKDASSFASAIKNGEDFELLFTMGQKEAARFFKTELARFGTDVSMIGEVVEKRNGIKLVDGTGRIRNIKAKGYTHFD